MNPKPVVSVIVLNYNGREFVKECLDSLCRQTYPALEVIVVDNHSADDSVAFIRQAYPAFKLLLLDQNLGFCEGNNRGVSLAAGEYVALLNNDAALPDNGVAEMVRSLEHDPAAWLVSPLIMNRNMDMSRYPHAGTMSVTGISIQNVFQDKTTIFGASGAALLFRKQAVGAPFDPDYRFFHEDVYLSWRTWLTGHRVIFRPDIQVDHLGSASFRKELPWYYWLQERNRWLNLFSFYQRRTIIQLIPLFILTILAEQLLVFRSWRMLVMRWRAYLWLLLHPLTIARKRKHIQAQRRVSDAVMLHLFSCRITNLANGWGRGLNSLAARWCRLCGIHTWDESGRPV